MSPNPAEERLPAAFVARMRSLLGRGDAAALFEALAQPPDVGLRLNPKRGNVEELLARLPWRLARLPWCPTALVLERGNPQGASTTPGRHPYQVAGAYYLQDPAATAVAEALAPEPGELVLDLAAAPGGKSTHLASLLAGEGWLVSNDVHPQRAQALVGNLERWGVANATVTNESPARLAEAWPGLFDRVLLDAPCSGEGMFRKSDDALAMWSEEIVLHCAARQDELLLAAARLVKPGGHLAYSTCTLAPEENEGSVARFVAASGFELVPLSLPGTEPGRPEWSGGAPLRELAGTARIWPHRAPGEGHFVALLRRPGAPGGGPATRAAGRRRRAGRDEQGPGRLALNAWREFAESAVGADAATEVAPTRLQGEWLLHAGEGAPPLDGLRWLRHGLQVGRLRRSARSARVEPAHALAMWLPPGVARGSVSLRPDDERVARYLQGEDVASEGAAGYVRVEVDGLPLGWGKRSGGTVRSLLPKGLRRPGAG